MVVVEDGAEVASGVDEDAGIEAEDVVVIKTTILIFWISFTTAKNCETCGKTSKLFSEFEKSKWRRLLP